MEHKRVLIFAEQIKGELQPIGLELLGAGRRLADKLEATLSALVLGHNIAHLPPILIGHGADQVFVADHPELAEYRTLPYRRVILDLIKSWPQPPHTILLGSTTTGRDLAPPSGRPPGDRPDRRLHRARHRPLRVQQQQRSRQVWLLPRLPVRHSAQLWRVPQGPHPRPLEKPADGHRAPRGDAAASLGRIPPRRSDPGAG